MAKCKSIVVTLNFIIFLKQKLDYFRNFGARGERLLIPGLHTMDTVQHVIKNKQMLLCVRSMILRYYVCVRVYVCVVTINYYNTAVVGITTIITIIIGNDSYYCIIDIVAVAVVTNARACPYHIHAHVTTLMTVTLLTLCASVYF